MPLTPRLAAALAARAHLLDARHETACRLFNGFYEGCPDLAVDLYADTLLLHNYAAPPAAGQAGWTEALAYLQKQLPWVTAAVLKTRLAPAAADRRGRLVFGQRPATRVKEDGVWYAVDLCLNRDASLYLDTRGLRAWARQSLAGCTVLNTFAYTGSLGVAALAGGAARVIQLDRNRQFLNLAKTSYTLNGFPIAKPDFMAGDFWAHASRLRRAGMLFDCAIIDPPYFATAATGTVDLNTDAHRLINKVRPLVKDGGWLVAINNALFVSGAAYQQTLQALCAEGYLTLADRLPVPADFTGYPETRVGAPPVDPAPFNHATKIALLRVRRKVG